jgi:hypothetical protein
MVVETRSQRQNSFPQRPPYPQIATPAASATQSVFQSTSSLASLSSVGSPTGQLPPTMLAPQQQYQQASASAPLPSPSSTQPATYFGASRAQSISSPTSHPAQQQRIPPATMGPVGGGGAYLGQRGGAVGGAPETAPFLKDFNLVAEAAKRAQMACLTRDFGDIGF